MLGRVCDHVNVFDAAVGHQQSGYRIRNQAAGPLPLEHLVECGDVIRVNAACDERERYRLPFGDLEEAVDLLRPRYFIRRDALQEKAPVELEVLDGGQGVVLATL